MSLYNLLHGVNPHAHLLLSFLGIGAADVPRFRDCYVEDGKIVIHTRTGGGNRGFYEHPDRCRAEYPEYFGGEDEPKGPWNSDLRKLPGFLYDEDGDFDCTYADFYFEPQPEVARLVEQLVAIGASGNPAQAWRKLFADMEAGKDTPQIARAVEAFRPVFESINNALETKGSGQ